MAAKYQVTEEKGMLPPTAHVMSRRAALEWLAEQLAWEQILDELRSGMVDAPNRAA